jgi:hypothetical protein
VETRLAGKARPWPRSTCAPKRRGSRPSRQPSDSPARASASGGGRTVGAVRFRRRARCLRGGTRAAEADLGGTPRLPPVGLRLPQSSGPPR